VDSLFIVQKVTEKKTAKEVTEKRTAKKEIYMTFIDLEKAYNFVPGRNRIW